MLHKVGRFYFDGIANQGRVIYVFFGIGGEPRLRRMLERHQPCLGLWRIYLQLLSLWPVDWEPRVTLPCTARNVWLYISEWNKPFWFSQNLKRGTTHLLLCFWDRDYNHQNCSGGPCIDTLGLQWRLHRFLFTTTIKLLHYFDHCRSYRSL